MSTMSYLSAIEHYHEYRNALQELLGSLVTGLSELRLLEDEKAQVKAMQRLSEHYPFFDMIYALDAKGVQTSENITPEGLHESAHGKGSSRSRRPYYIQAKDSNEVVVTDPYFSNVTGALCLSAALRMNDDEGKALGFIVLDIDLVRAIEYLMGDTTRRNFQPGFRGVYILIVFGLFSVVVSLLYLAFNELGHMIWGAAVAHEMIFKPFTVIIYLTLGLAIFDLGKTILEEEVLMHKDIFRHSSTRRTITRFIAAILIAVSIESLLLMFKSALGEGSEYLLGAVAMMVASVGLLIGLGIYVFLGAKAEQILKNTRKGGG